MHPSQLRNDTGRQQWRRMLLAIEQMLVLADKYPGMLADDLAGYLFARSSGHLASLMSLINRGAQRAVRTGTERFTTELLDKVRIDEALAGLVISDFGRLFRQRPVQRRSCAGARYKRECRSGQ